MSYTKDTPISGTTNVRPQQVIDYFASQGAKGNFRTYIPFIFEHAPSLNINPMVVIGQWADETDKGRSPRWLKGDPAGIGIFSDNTPSQLDDDLSGEESGAIHLAELKSKIDRKIYSYIAGINVAELDPHLERVRVFINRADWPIIKKLDDLRIPLKGGDFTWAENQNYGVQIAGHMNAIQSYADTHPVKGNNMAIVATECPIELRVVTKAAVNRPQLAMPDASFVTVHEVGNTSPGADEEMHARFVHNGGGEHAVSFHFIVGPTKAIQLIYLNENAWHASDYYSGRGNRDSIAIETVQIGDFNRTMNHLAYLIAEIYRNPDRFSWRTDVGRVDDLLPALMKERTKQHNYWAPDQKNCPSQIRGRGLWLPLLDAVATELKDAAPALPKYAAPILPEWWSEQAVLDLRTHVEDDIRYTPMGMRLRCIKETGAYAHPWLPEGKGKRTRENIMPGDAVDLRYRTTHPTTNRPVGITKHGTWIYLSYFSPQVTLRHVNE